MPGQALTDAAYGTVRDEKNPEPLPLIAASIIKLAAGLGNMKASGLSMRAMQVLLKDATGVSLQNIDRILNAAPRLRSMYLAPVPGGLKK